MRTTTVGTTTVGTTRRNLTTANVEQTAQHSPSAQGAEHVFNSWWNGTADDAGSRVSILMLAASSLPIATIRPIRFPTGGSAEVEAAFQLSEQHDIRSDEFAETETLYAAAPIQLRQQSARA